MSVAHEARQIAQLLALLDEDAFAGPTNCPPWTVKELLVHTWQTLVLPARFRPPPSEAAPARAADWYRRAERTTPDYRQASVDRARAAATSFPTGWDAARALVGAAKTIDERLRVVGRGTLIGHPAVGAIRFGDFVVTRVISLAVHGIDLAISLGHAPVTTGEALDTTAGVVEELLGTTAAELGCTRLELVLWGTGRAEPPAARRLPPEVRDRLPVIS